MAWERGKEELGRVRADASSCGGYSASTIIFTNNGKRTANTPNPMIGSNMEKPSIYSLSVV